MGSSLEAPTQPLPLEVSHGPKLNRKGLDHARSLVKDGQIERDTRDDWSEHAPSADEENAFIERHGFSEFAKWHLCVDPEKTEGTKGSVSFPFGDFRKVHRLRGCLSGKPGGTAWT